MASPFKKIANFFKKPAENRGTGKTYPNSHYYLYEMMEVENDRKKVYQECWVMYNEDARISAAIDTTAGSATNGGFTVKFNNAKSSNQKIIKDSEEIIDGIIKNTKLMGRVSNIAKELLILGDMFLERLLLILKI